MDKYTEEGLPVISKETFESLATYLDRELTRGSDFGVEVYDLLKKENPVITDVMQRALLRYPGTDFSDGVNFGVVFLYKLFKEQGASNELERQLENGE